MFKNSQNIFHYCVLNDFIEIISLKKIEGISNLLFLIFISSSLRNKQQKWYK